MMTAIYPTVPNIFLDTNTLYIVIIANLISKTFTFNKGTRLGSIHEYIDTSYIIIDITKAFIAIATASITVSKLFTAI